MEDLLVTLNYYCVESTTLEKSEKVKSGNTTADMKNQTLYYFILYSIIRKMK